MSPIHLSRITWRQNWPKFWIGVLGMKEDILRIGLSISEPQHCQAAQYTLWTGQDHHLWHQVKRLQNQRPTLVAPHDVSTSVKQIWIGNVLLLETFLVRFSPRPNPFGAKMLQVGFEFFKYIYLQDTSTILNREGSFSFRSLDAIESRNFNMSSCFSCWISGKVF